MRVAILASVGMGVLLSCRMPTSAIVHRFETVGQVHAFRHCQIRLEWALQELIDNCGMPERFVVDAADPSTLCAVYSTQAVTFAQGVGAEYLAACMEEGRTRGPKLKQPIRVVGLKAASVSDYRVKGVYGLKVAPPRIANPATGEAEPDSPSQPEQPSAAPEVDDRDLPEALDSDIDS